MVTSSDPSGPAEGRVRLQRLLELTSRLSESIPADEVARIVVDQARAAVGAVTALMWKVEDPPARARLVGATGNEPAVLERYAHIPLEPWLPMGDAMLRCEPLFFPSRTDFRQRYEIAERQLQISEVFRDLAYACLPLVVEGRAVGGVALVFPHPHDFEDDERMFLTVLAHHAAQALERASLFERERAARAAADEAGRAKDRFLAMLGHELRNPLAPIVTALDLMRLRGAGVLERERAVIERQARHLVRLVDDLMEVSRSVHGGLRLERAPLELSVVAGDAVEAAGPLVEERHQTLTVSVPTTGLVVEADRGRLAQVLTNLLKNAATYTPQGGHVALSARADGDHVTLEVADNGTGIGPDLLPRIFDAFTQGPQGLDRKRGGLGLGLAIARQLIAGHDGTIEARSAGPDRGTTMVVTLPRRPAPSKADMISRDPAGPTADSIARRVLLVEDNPDAAALLASALALAGHDVRTAGDGPSALKLVEGYAPDIALLDIGLPGMDGYELARQLRRAPSLANTPLVALTGYARDGDRQRALASGFSEHIAKPVPLARLLELVDRLSGAPKRG
jgi:signal transduction histidine kinase